MTVVDTSVSYAALLEGVGGATEGGKKKLELCRTT